MTLLGFDTHTLCKSTIPSIEHLLRVTNRFHGKYASTLL